MRTLRGRKAVAFAGAVALAFMPISIGPLDNPGLDAAAPVLGVAEACAQSYGCFWDPNGSPPCPDPDLGYPWYCNFGCDPG